MDLFNGGMRQISHDKTLMNKINILQSQPIFKKSSKECRNDEQCSLQKNIKKTSSRFAIVNNYPKMSRTDMNKLKRNFTCSLSEQTNEEILKKQSCYVNNFLKKTIGKNKGFRLNSNSDESLYNIKSSLISSHPNKNMMKLSSQTLGQLHKQKSLDNIIPTMFRRKRQFSMEDQELFVKTDNIENENKELAIPTIPLMETMEDLFDFSLQNKKLNEILPALINDNGGFRRLFRSEVLSDSEMSEDLLLEEDNDSIFILSPNNIYLHIFNSIILIVIIYTSIYIPVVISLYRSDPYFAIIISIINDVIFILDLILNFFIGYIDNEEKLVLNYKKAWSHYIQSTFWLDLLLAFPFNILPMESYPVLKLLQLLRILKLNRFTEKQKDSLLHEKIIGIRFIKAISVHNALYTFIQFFIGLFIFSHISSCIFIFIASFDYPNWITERNYQESSFVFLYVSAIYFTFVSIFSVGYGDITSTNIYERVYNIILMIFGVCLYSFAISILSSLIEKSQEQQREDNKNLYLLHDIKKTYNISDELFKKLYRFITYSKFNQKANRDFLIEDLPKHTKNNLVFKMYEGTISRLNFFKSTSHDFQYKVAIQLKQITSIKNEYIIEADDMIDEFYMINKGIIQVKKKTSYHDQIIKILQFHQNEHFGEIYMLLGIPMPLDIITESKIAELFYLRKSDFVDLYEEFPNVITAMLKDSWKNTLRMEARAKKLYKKIEIEEEKRIFTLYESYTMSHNKGKGIDKESKLPLELIKKREGNLIDKTRYNEDNVLENQLPTIKEENELSLIPQRHINIKNTENSNRNNTKVVNSEYSLLPLNSIRSNTQISHGLGNINQLRLSTSYQMKKLVKENTFLGSTDIKPKIKLQLKDPETKTNANTNFNTNINTNININVNLNTNITQGSLSRSIIGTSGKKIKELFSSPKKKIMKHNNSLIPQSSIHLNQPIKEEKDNSPIKTRRSVVFHLPLINFTRGESLSSSLSKEEDEDSNNNGINLSSISEKSKKSKQHKPKKKSKNNYKPHTPESDLRVNLHFSLHKKDSHKKQKLRRTLSPKKRHRKCTKIQKTNSKESLEQTTPFNYSSDNDTQSKKNRRSSIKQVFTNMKSLNSVMKNPSDFIKSIQTKPLTKINLTTLLKQNDRIDEIYETILLHYAIRAPTNHKDSKL